MQGDQRAAGNGGEVAAKLREVRQAIAERVVGMHDEIDHVLLAVLADRHVLLEGVPGIGKTHLATTLTTVLGCAFKRVQFTPDLLPSDILGSFVYNPRDGSFELRKGPIFANIVLADEINRAPAKTQSALLEVMQERQVTIEGVTNPIDRPFLVIATQNPLEHEGVYPLPLAQLDRFAMRLLPGYPSESDEIGLLSVHRRPLPESRVVLDASLVVAAQRVIRDVLVSDEILMVIRRLCQATREHAAVALGASPRLGLDLMQLARARAVVDERAHVIPDDLKSLFPPVANHRLALTPQAEISGRTVEDVIHDALLATKLV